MRHPLFFIFCKSIFTLIFISLLMAGCSSETNNTKVTSEESSEKVVVEIKTEPKEIKVNDKIEIQALVTQGNDPVTDADDVEFELWKDGEKKHEKIQAVHQGEGKYTINKSFSLKGVYYIIAHTNARGMHTMPEIKISVV
ncbi:FixH family protein [Priestia megaterium]|uniref:FixH family protein n=1 Tax=Priestia megaterium TaxID=1404 RepID=UPI000BFD2E24|nr:FixH family protein [Priestia megaterium]MBW0934207.1 FixH family protein [Priestia megaterium]PGX80593.1 hypothetical protein COE31_04555 [Priestia megaterium]